MSDMLDRLGGVRDVLRMTSGEVFRKHNDYLNPIVTMIVRFLGMNRRFVEARGIHLKDDSGRKYLDFLSGFGALNLGHEPPEVLQALRLVEESPNIMQASLNPFAAKLAEYLAEVTPGDLSRSFFCNSGAEAVEAALKLARAATGRRMLLFAEGAYHGKTFGALSVSGREKYKKPFAPLLPDTQAVPYGDLEALRKSLSNKTAAAFIVEPIQGENGVLVPPDGYLKGAEELCREFGTLLLVDEVQTGVGRTGKLFACEHEGVEPDVLILSKALGGGVMPIGAMVTTDIIWKKAYGSLETGLLHSSTFGGNSRACACGIATLRAVLSKNLPAKAAAAGRVLLKKARALTKRSTLLREVRGKGLLLGLVFVRVKGKSPLMEGAITLWVARQMFLRHGIVMAFTLNNLDVLRIAPPLNITQKHIEYFIDSLSDVLKSAEKLRALLLVGKEEQTYA
ncbi:MAG: aspartate aminotransferase family protein [Candidatus Omnitrophota bacterium]|nr:aspartate aminotransferase family protein [Candidatus Omnitrophota bacterium]